MEHMSIFLRDPDESHLTGKERHFDCFSLKMSPSCSLGFSVSVVNQHSSFCQTLLLQSYLRETVRTAVGFTVLLKGVGGVAGDGPTASSTHSSMASLQDDPSGATALVSQQHNAVNNNNV